MRSMVVRVLALGLLLWAASAQALTVQLAWDAPTGGSLPEHYVLYRKIAHGEFELLAVIAVPTLTYTDHTTESGLHCYEVTATNAEGESSPSNEVCLRLSKNRALRGN